MKNLIFQAVDLILQERFPKLRLSIPMLLRLRQQYGGLV